MLNNDKEKRLLELYHKYIREVFNVQDISRWTSKKTITESVLNPERTNEQKILDALKGRPAQMGDKIYVYFDTDNKLMLQEDWTPGSHNSETLLKKLFKTLVIFKNVIDINQFPKYHLKNKKIKEELQKVLSEN